MQVDELLKPFPIKEFHPFPRALLGPGSHEMIGPEAKKLGFASSSSPRTWRSSTTCTRRRTPSTWPH
jgi:hypothetical protein